MNFLKITLIGLCLTFTGLNARAQDKNATPTEILSALGGLAAISAFNGHIALGRNAEADMSTEEAKLRCAKEIGGIGGGMNAVVGMLEKCTALLPESEKAGFQAMVDTNKLIAEQAAALVEVFKAKKAEEGVEEATQKFAEVRAKCAQTIHEQMGIELDMLK
jgi:hypothetical protein